MAKTLDSLKQGARVAKKAKKDLDEVRGTLEELRDGHEKKLSGVGFWMIVGFALLKDIADVFMHGTLVLSVLAFFVTATAYLTLYLYLAIKGVPLWGTRRIATYAVSALIEVLPVVGAFPAFTLMIIAIRVLENNRILKKAVHKGKDGSLVGSIKKHVPSSLRKAA